MGIKKSPGQTRPGVGARVGSHRAPRSRPLDRIATFSGPGLGQAVLTWSRPWNGTGERNASTASTTAATRARVCERFGRSGTLDRTKVS